MPSLIPDDTAVLLFLVPDDTAVLGVDIPDDTAVLLFSVPDDTAVFYPLIPDDTAVLGTPTTGRHGGFRGRHTGRHGGFAPFGTGRHGGFRQKIPDDTAEKTEKHRVFGNFAPSPVVVLQSFKNLLKQSKNQQQRERYRTTRRVFFGRSEYTSGQHGEEGDQIQINSQTRDRGEAV
ncbi:hypothetical protein [Deinococcus ruber]|uniref:hypothetical protein n=1 Tax=Deinococcus ruber TaxID=1848197 RepID=UPI00166CB5BC|nr:hypothetical protein [Deinococcus ruber]